MLAETSNVSMTMPSIRGNGKVSCGLADAKARRATPTRKIRGGMWRRRLIIAAVSCCTTPRVPSLAESLILFRCRRR